MRSRVRLKTAYQRHFELAQWPYDVHRGRVHGGHFFGTERLIVLTHVNKISRPKSPVLTIYTVAAKVQWLPNSQLVALANLLHENVPPAKRDRPVQPGSLDLLHFPHGLAKP